MTMSRPATVTAHQSNKKVTSSGEDGEAVMFLTLGDGDFSYSLDMAKFLQQGVGRKLFARIVATGIDSVEEVHAKYRNAPYLTKKIQTLNSDALSISIRYGINAIQPPSDPETSQAHHVIFNHPHLGREDAALHSRFLSHFLYTARKYWMRPNGGVLHLTLVKGQYQRWKCHEAMERHGLVLLEGNNFVSPGTHYRHRCHQSGKSFASRVMDGSETITLGRKCDGGRYVATCLPWQHAIKQDLAFACPHCERTFREERSRTSHAEAVHSNEKKRKSLSDLECKQCEDNGTVRTFAHEQALTDHIRAKHSSLHSRAVNDAPSSHKPNDVKTGPENETTPIGQFGCCQICGLVYTSGEDEYEHLNEFVPIALTKDDMGKAQEFLCSICAKAFREKRAQLQHENFCGSVSKDQLEGHNIAADDEIGFSPRYKKRNCSCTS